MSIFLHISHKHLENNLKTYKIFFNIKQIYVRNKKTAESWVTLVNKKHILNIWTLSKCLFSNLWKLIKSGSVDFHSFLGWCEIGSLLPMFPHPFKKTSILMFSLLGIDSQGKNGANNQAVICESVYLIIHVISNLSLYSLHYFCPLKIVICGFKSLTSILILKMPGGVICGLAHWFKTKMKTRGFQHCSLGKF